MINISELMEQYMLQAGREFEIKAEINGTTYDDSSLIRIEREDNIISGDDFELGTVISARLNISLKTSNTIPTNAQIKPFVRLIGDEGPTDWLQLGEFYIDSRSYQNQIWEFTCYDKLILSNQQFVSALIYPAKMDDVFDEICELLDVERDSSVVIDPTYMIPYKDEDITINEMLSYIASANGASVRINNKGKIVFVKFSASAEAVATIVPAEYKRAKPTNPLKEFTKVVLTYNTDGETITKGSGDADHTLNIYNPFMTEEMLEAVYEEIDGLTYMPMEIEWRGRLQLEVGDRIAVEMRDSSEVETIILRNKIMLRGGLWASIQSPAYSAQQSEFDYKGRLNKLLKNAGGGLQENQPYYGVTIGRANGLKIEKSDGSSKVVLNSDTLAWQVQVAGEMFDRLYFDAVEGDLKYNGKFGVEALEALKADIQVLVADLLYGEKANIAELTVDSIDTSIKIQKYLAKDKSPVGYWKGQKEYIEFIDAHVKVPEATEHVEDRQKRPLYWTNDTFTKVSPEETEYPVLTYAYDELIKLRIFHQFDEVTGYANPRIELGVGASTTYPNRGKAVIWKDVMGLKIQYTKIDGDLVTLELGENGLILSNNLEQADFYTNGFEAKYNGVITTFQWTKDSEGRITKLIASDGSEIPINWHGGAL